MKNYQTLILGIFIGALIIGAINYGLADVDREIRTYNNETVEVWEPTAIYSLSNMRQEIADLIEERDNFDTESLINSCTDRCGEQCLQEGIDTYQYLQGIGENPSAAEYREIINNCQTRCEYICADEAQITLEALNKRIQILTAKYLELT